MRPAVSDQDLIQWINSLPRPAQRLAEQFPPGCAVEALRELGNGPAHRRIPEGGCGFVVSYGEPDYRHPKGCLYVSASSVQTDAAIPAEPRDVRKTGVFERCTDMPGDRDTLWVAKVLGLLGVTDD